jgi:enoyl-CoA hydratase
VSGNDYSRYTFLRTEVRDHIAHVVLSRPEKANACRRQEHAEFATILRDLAVDDDVRVVLISSTGRSFSVGADYDYMEELVSDRHALAELQVQASELVHAHIDLDKPVVCAMQGAATGSGLMFGLLSDIVVADRDARIADGHVTIALAAGDGGAMIWPLAMGLVRAKRHLLTGDWITAEQAERYGLIAEVVDNGQCLARATEYAERFVAMPQLALRFTKRALNQWMRHGAQVAFDFSLALEVQTFALAGDEVRAAVAQMQQRLDAHRGAGGRHGTA